MVSRHAEQLGGKPMSYNNYVDADAAWRAVWDFAPQIAVAVVKHNNPCGLAVGATVAEAHKKAHACDPMSAYGGVIAREQQGHHGNGGKRPPDFHRGDCCSRL